MNIYDAPEAPILDERHLAGCLGVNQAQVREALVRLEEDGLVQTIPRRGDYIGRKTITKIIKIVSAWAALESMTERLTPVASNGIKIFNLRNLFAKEGGDRAIHSIIDHIHIIEAS